MIEHIQEVVVIIVVVGVHFFQHMCQFDLFVFEIPV